MRGKLADQHPEPNQWHPGLHSVPHSPTSRPFDVLSGGAADASKGANEEYQSRATRSTRLSPVETRRKRFDAPRTRKESCLGESNYPSVASS
jgi:hypothetical protein